MFRIIAMFSLCICVFGANIAYAELNDNSCQGACGNPYVRNFFKKETCQQDIGEAGERA